MLEGIPELASTASLVLLGAGVGLIVAYFQHYWTAKRGDHRRDLDTRASRVQHEREIIGGLVVATLAWANAVANLMLALRRASGGGHIDHDDVYRLLRVADEFNAALIRARLSVCNPAARPSLDNLRDQHIAMTNVNLEGIGRTLDGAEIIQRLEEFSRVTGEAIRALEEAALKWYGAVPHLESVRP